MVPAGAGRQGNAMPSSGRGGLARGRDAQRAHGAVGVRYARTASYSVIQGSLTSWSPGELNGTGPASTPRLTGEGHGGRSRDLLFAFVHRVALLQPAG